MTHTHAQTLLILLLICLLHTARAATITVGPTRADKTLGAVLGRLKPGDTVQIDPGVYHETAKISAVGTREAPITIEGAAGGARPVFDAQGLDTSGEHSQPRGVFEITGAFVTIAHLEFKNARNAQNAAGVRFNDSTDATVRDCKVTYCDMGIFGGDKDTATIEDSEIAFNGTEKFNGGSHNFYMHGNKVVVRRCFIHDSLFGQNYKSRAHYNELWYNWITDSNEGEVGCVDEPGATDRPNSNTLLVGNTIISKAERTGNAAKYVLQGSELGGSHDGTLYLFRNTFIAGSPRVHFVTLDDPKTRLVAQDNVFVGSDQILTQARPSPSVIGNHNLLPKTAQTPAGWTDTPGLPLTYTDGDGKAHTLPPSG